MKVIVAGGRDFDDYGLLVRKLNKILDGNNATIVSGHAKGADSLGERYATTYELKLKVFPAEWHKYGHGAGHVRNRQMAEYADVLVAFWDGESKGTRGMIHDAIELGLEVHIYRYTGGEDA
jgi:hypothetical protein